MRGGWAVDAAQAAVPESLTPLVAALTHFGDPLVVLVLLAAVYWVGPRRGWLGRPAAARLLAVGFTALALTVLLKGGFGWPRPPVELHRVPTDGHGFPSGHATAAAAAYGGLAALLDRGTARARAGAAAVLIGLVATTRVVLGLHFLVDVVAGVAVGTTALVAVLWVARDRPTRGFALASVVAAGSLLVAGPTADAATALGGTVGATVALAAVGDAALDRAAAPWPVLLGGGALLTAATVATLATPLPALVVVAVTAVIGAGVVALPALRTSRGTSPSPTR